ncbi:hypothetical protein VTI74DRAFT_1836 [Chaetomium olivicolor]
MKSSAFLAACGAILATASPILQDRRVFVKTDIVVEWVTITVTEGDTATTVFRRPGPRPKPTTTTTLAAPSSTSTSVAPPPPPPPPSTSEPAVQTPPAPTPESSPAPSPEVKAAPSPDPAPAVIVPSPQPTTSAAPAPQPTPTKADESAAQPSDYISTALYHHNVHRFNHSATALEWSDEHAGYAKTLAERCVFAHDVSIGNGPYGQNLAMWGSSAQSAQSMDPSILVARAASNGWYNNELNLFPSGDYGKASPDMSNFSKWGHFSQVVWAGTKKVGCATVFCPAGTMSASMGSWYTVCNYYPAGNMGGAYGENVKPPLGQAGITAA